MQNQHPSALSHCRMIVLSSLLVGACFHKANQYDPTQDPALFPGAQGGTAGGIAPAGGGGGASRSSDGPGQAGNGPEPSNQVCGTTCDAEKSDGCCPVGCTGASDVDCKAQCGNDVLERGEQCDPPSSCPASCPNRGCTKFTLEGSAAECTAVCVEAGKETACKPDDGCCPAGCTTADDNDCAIMCGNGAKEGNETCDPLASCPTACPAEACQLKKLVNAGTCTAECVNDRLQTACTPGDGCCPPGCHTGNDADCMAACDNGIKESGETCDPLASCPAACPPMECQLRKLNNPGTCKAQCVNDRLQTACQSGDDCCPPGCNTANDNDCGVRCGDGIKDPSETCDPLSTCPTSCPAMGCQLRELRNPGTCKAACENSRTQTACAPNDDCCPGACHANNDSDCQPRCGNGVVERDEKCEPVAECTRRQTACKSDRDTIRTGQGNPAQCTFECSESQRQCGAADGQCPSGCQNDPDCKRTNGSACDNAGQCLSNRCTDGRCCAETCGACQKCTGGGGTCQLPGDVKVCNGSCISRNECCGCNLSTRCDGTGRVVRGICNNGSCDVIEVDRCGDCESCSGNRCQSECGNGETCVGGQCKKANGQRCNSNNECANGNCDGPLKCVSGTNDTCPCKVGSDCESRNCGGNKTCGGRPANQCGNCGQVAKNCCAGRRCNAPLECFGDANGFGECFCPDNVPLEECGFN